MKLKISFFLTIIFILLISLPLIIQAQSPGCLGDIGPDNTLKYEVIQSYNLAPDVRENASPQADAQGIFYHNRIALTQTMESDWRVILSSDPQGHRAFCTDDLIRIESSTGRMFEHDFRAADRSRIVPLEPLDVTRFFNENALWLEISLIDLSPQFRSSSAYYLVIINPSASDTLPPTANIVMPTPLTVGPTSTLSISPTLSSTNTPAPTSTIIPTPAIFLPTPEPEPRFTSLLPESPPPLNIILGLILLNIATSLGLWMFRRPRLNGVLKIIKNGEPWKTVDLSAYGRRVTIGDKGQIKLENDDEENPTLPAVAVRLVARRGAEGNVHIIWESVEDDADLEPVSHQLQHGDVEFVGSYRFEYENFSEIPEIEDSLEGGIWNEVQ